MICFLLNFLKKKKTYSWHQNNNRIFFLCFRILFLFLSISGVSQENQQLFFPHLETEAGKFGPFSEDFKDYIVTNSHLSERSGVHHFYLNQRYKGIEIKNGVLSIHVDKSGKLIALHNQFLTNIQGRVSALSPEISALDAIKKAADYFSYDQNITPQLIQTKDTPSREQLYGSANISQIDIPVKLVYQPVKNGDLRLAWDLSILAVEGSDWWSIRVDAANGDILDQENWTVSCHFGEHKHSDHNELCLPNHQNFVKGGKTISTSNNLNLPNSYNVFPLGIESPNHGPQTLEINPAEAIASPFGWHDTNGINGAEFTTTKGNNVEAKDDIAGDNETTTGAFANGGSNLEFDFPVNFNLIPSGNVNAAVTNLFYWNNIMHDVWYQYGFTEAAGNFQENSYGRGGIANDFVRADGLDGGGTNNANFSTPPDGTKPRMQMYLWNASANTTTFTIHTPENISGSYTAVKANFGPSEFNLTGDLVLADPVQACGALTNGASLNGKIAVIDRGSCEFGFKCLNAQNAGAIAVIICNNVSGSSITMAPGANGGSVTIPCIMLSQADCNQIKVFIPGANATMAAITGQQIDGDLDNGIIAHEYGHGISIRLTGGAGNVSCLNNEEQMGEGWSDWFGIMLTLRASDNGVTGKGIGTYALNQPVTGNGIRTYKYSTNMVTNPHTYNSIKTAAIPHGIGSVWCVMLWDMTWLLIDAYGFDPDYYGGQGGNNIAMALVTEALKLQPCSPGFVDGRNAILLADDMLYGGIHKCLIWKAFARRGLGFSAIQGLSSSRSDGTQAFDMPTLCCNQVYIKDDSGTGSLRDVLTCVTSGSTITFAPFMDSKTINLTGGIVINKDVSIISDTPNGVKITTGNNVPTMTINNFNVVLQNLGIIGGNATTGRALVNNGNLICNDVLFIDSQISNVSGGSIVNNGTILFNGSSALKKE